MAESGPQKILIVDDASFTRLVLRRALEKHNYKIIEAASVEEGYSLFLQKSPGLVITDLMLPDGTGLKLFEQALDARITPFFLITHINDERQLDSARAMGFTEVLQKPIDPDAMIKLVQCHLPGADSPAAEVKEITLRLDQRVVDAATKGAAGAKLSIDDFLCDLVKQALLVEEPQKR